MGTIRFTLNDEPVVASDLTPTSTLLRWLALIHARARLKGATHATVAPARLGLDGDVPVDLGPARLPVLVRIADYSAARAAACAGHSTA